MSSARLFRSFRHRQLGVNAHLTASDFPRHIFEWVSSCNSNFSPDVLTYWESADANHMSDSGTERKYFKITIWFCPACIFMLIKNGRRGSRILYLLTCGAGIAFGNIIINAVRINDLARCFTRGAIVKNIDIQQSSELMFDSTSTSMTLIFHDKRHDRIQIKLNSVQ
jgi:hypothetical protein